MSCDTGNCIKKVEIEIVSDDGGDSDDDDRDDDTEYDENTRVSKVRRSKRKGVSSSSKQ